MDLQPVVESDLIIIRPLKENDYDTLFKVASDALIWEQHTSKERGTIDGFRTFFNESINSEGALLVIDKATTTIIGSTRFKKQENFPDSVEIGWSFLAREYWGGLYNSAMKQLMIDYAFEIVENVVFFVDKDNLRSQNAVLKLGAHQQSREDNNAKDSITNLTYIINKKDWK